MATRKVDLVQRGRTTSGGNYRHVEWSRAVPFAASVRGRLIHRVRYAGSIVRGDVHSHDWVTYWCGNGTIDPTWLENPPDGRVVCAACEAKAVAQGELSADKLVGKHVCKGVLVALKTCCHEVN